MDLNRYSSIFKALGHPMRLKMVLGILKNECNVNNIVKTLKLPQSTASQHLGILRNVGIITPNKRGTRTCYRVSNSNILAILKIISRKGS